MRSVSLLLVAGALLSQSACLLLRHPKDGAPPSADTDHAGEETEADADTDATTDDADADDAPADTDTDPASADTDPASADTDPATADTDSATADTDSGAAPPDTDPAAADTDPALADTDSASAPVDTAPDTDLPVGPNQAPTVGVPALDPTPAYNTSTLTCSAAASDPDGPMPTVTYAWTNVTTGQSLGAGGSLGLDATTGSPGDTVRCAATASDGTLTATSSATVVLDDRAPVVGTPTIVPALTTVTSVLTCAATASDPDGTTPTLSYAWTNETTGTTLGSSSSVTLSGATATAGDTVRCRVTASDGTLSSSSSVALTVGSTNRAPVVGTPAITPTPAYNTTALSCAATSSDPDGTTPAVTYAWTNVTQSTSLGSGASKTLTSGTASPGDTIQCAVTASDGTLTATSNGTVVLTNRAPVVGTPGITPSPATVTSTLSCAATTSDPDGTTPVVTYAWTNVTQSTTLGSSSSVVLSAATASGGDKIRCTVTATDGALSGSSYGEAALAVVAPTILGAWQTIPAGTFTMGCVVGRDDVGTACQGAELPTHSVTLTHSFWMMQSEVTQAMWSSLKGTAPSGFSVCGSTCPVETVTWWDAASFANAASVAEGLSSCYAFTGCTGGTGCTGVTVNTVSGSLYDCEGYRLPTEAEWEYAARGGTSSAYAGSGVVADVAWTSANARSTPHAVCSKAQNGYGLCDMSGNVQEWIWDWYASPYTAGAQTNPTGPASGGRREYRGGSWLFAPSYARVAYRYYTASTYRDIYIGFRLVRSVP